MDLRAFIGAIAGGLLIAPLAAAETPGPPPGDRVLIVDTHVHPLRSLRRGGSAISASELLRLMNTFSVERMVLLPPPFPEGHPGTYGAREIKGIVRDGHGRTAPRHPTRHR